MKSALIALSASTLLATLPAQAQTGGPGNPPPDDGCSSVFVPGDGGGSRSSIHGNRMAVGSPYFDGPLTDVGKVTIWNRQGDAWTLQATIDAPSSTTKDLEFGKSVGLSGSWLAVGAPVFFTTSSNGGSISIFEEVSPGVWTQRPGFAGDADRNFGDNNQLRIDSTHLVFSDSGKVAGKRGQAIVFENFGGTWSISGSGNLHDLPAPNTHNPLLSEYGDTVALHGNRIAVAATGAQKVYTYRKVGANWTFEQEISPPAIGPGDVAFGTSLALIQDRLVVGAPLYDVGGAVDGGEVFVYDRIGGVWTHTQTLAPTIPRVSGDWFGHSVGARDDDTVVVGARFVDSGAGAAYVFRGQTLEEVRKFMPTAAGEEVHDISRPMSASRAGVGSLEVNGGAGGVWVIDHTGCPYGTQ